MASLYSPLVPRIFIAGLPVLPGGRSVKMFRSLRRLRLPRTLVFVPAFVVIPVTSKQRIRRLKWSSEFVV
jgi:hypothetical protein